MNKWIKNQNSGFTLIELIVSIAIIVMLFSIATINISPLPSNTLQSTNQDQLLADIKSQQTLAMSTNSDYGVHFETNSYTLFVGNTYTQGLQENFVVSLDDGINFENVTFANETIVFSAGSGDILGYVSGLDSFDIKSAVTNKNTTIRINKYGATY